MDAADAARSNGASPEAREARSPPGPVGSPENGAKADSKDAKTTNGHSGEAAEGKSPGSTPRPGEGKGTLFLGGEWRRPIVQFVESVDDKGPNYFSMDSGDGRRPPYAGLQLGAAKKPPVTFAEKGELRKSIFSEPRKPAPAIGEPGDARRHSVPRAAPGGLLRAKPGAEEVLCDSCIGNKQKAVKSCLVCQASFCELHLKPHLEGAAFRDHPLLEPICDFEARKCPLHGKTMELFCQTDQTCICYLCMFQEHKNHSTVTVEEAKAEKEVPPPAPLLAWPPSLLPAVLHGVPQLWGCCLLGPWLSPARTPQAEGRKQPPASGHRPFPGGAGRGSGKIGPGQGLRANPRQTESGTQSCSVPGRAASFLFKGESSIPAEQGWPRERVLGEEGI